MTADVKGMTVEQQTELYRQVALYLNDTVLNADTDKVSVKQVRAIARELARRASRGRRRRVSKTGTATETPEMREQLENKVLAALGGRPNLDGDVILVLPDRQLGAGRCIMGSDTFRAIIRAVLDLTAPAASPVPPVVPSVPRPEIVCLCGSTRFVETFNAWRKRLTYDGCIVLSIEIVTTQAQSEDPQHVDPDRKAKLDELHLRKIDLADRVLVLNVGGYIGDSTRNEIAYATRLGKRIDYLEPVAAAAVTVEGESE